MNLSFHIQPPGIDTAEAHLFVEINAHGLSYLILDNGNCKALVVYHFKKDTSFEDAAEHIHQIVKDQPVLKQPFKKVDIIYGYTPFVMVPGQFMKGTKNDGNAMLDLLYGDVSEMIIRTDFMDNLSINNFYGIPAVIDKVVSRYFNMASFKHLFSLLPAVVKSAGNYLYCIFSTGQLKIMLLKEGKLQVLQHYKYQSAEDVSYHLLNLCNSFEVNVEEIVVCFSGMIDESSPLYGELLKYFKLVSFEELPPAFQYPEEINNYPPHYFSHLFAIASCV